jgi:hypothetical protein
LTLGGRGDCPPIRGDDSADLGLSLGRLMAGDDDMALISSYDVVAPPADDFNLRCGADRGAAGVMEEEQNPNSQRDETFLQI